MSTATHTRTRRGIAFTLTELLVVIIIIVLVAAIAIPSFSAMMYSSESTLAGTRLTTVLRAGRDVAIRSSGDEDSALVFFYEPGGRLTVVTCLKVGQLEDVLTAGGTQTILRDVFVPVDLIQPVQMPRGWMVRGYAPAHSTDEGNVPQGDPRTGWYEAGPGGQRYGNPSNPSVQLVGDWVFPETGFYDTQIATDGAKRQTFMVRFQAGTGRMVTSPAEPALVISPRPTTAGRNADPYDGFRIDQAADLRRFVRRVLQDPLVDDGGTLDPDGPQVRRELLGDESGDTVLARPVGQLALYDESKLAAALGASIDRTTGCLYAAGNYPQFVNVPGFSGIGVGQRIAQWIEGDTNFDTYRADRDRAGPGGITDAPQCRIYTIDRYTAEARQVEIEP